MEAYGSKIHQTYYCFDSTDRPLIEVMNLPQGQEGKTAFPNNEIVFVLEGNLNLFLSDHPGGDINKGQFVFLSAGDTLKYKVNRRSTILIVRLHEMIPSCRTFSIEKLYGNNKPVKTPAEIAKLEMNPHAWHFASGLAGTLGDGLKCRNYLNAKITEFLFMLRAYYTEKQLSGFFYPILSPDAEFSENIRKNHRQFKTVKEMAASMNMTSKQFTRKFRKVFSQSPYKWMKGEKERLIYNEIRTTSKPFKQIAYEQGFHVPAHFTAFCRTAFGKTPEMLRKE